jgi:hypothetical protein
MSVERRLSPKEMLHGLNQEEIFGQQRSFVWLCMNDSEVLPLVKLLDLAETGTKHSFDMILTS